MDSRPTKYRKNVAVFVLNGSGQILICRRTDKHHTWQLPQGGIDEGESCEQAMFRELNEEIGTTQVDIIGSLPNSICYDWPKELFSRGYLGQEQFYYLVRLAEGAIISLDSDSSPEFDQSKWIGANGFLALITGFKVAAYSAALEQFRKLFQNTIID